jgi:RNA polymerase sigma-70 factor (ECF subfamily)
MTSEEEYALVQRIQSGDSDAFAVLMDLYQKQVYHLALRTVGNPEDAADMTQEAFLRAYRAIGSFRGDSKLSVWLYRLTQNVCIDFLRSRGRKPTVSLTVENETDEIQELDVADDRFDPEVQYQRKALRDAVRRGLDELPEEYRTILVLREINGLSYAEIGEQLQLEEGTVKSRLFRARKKLCEFLQRDGNLPDTYASKNINGGVKQ